MSVVLKEVGFTLSKEGEGEAEIVCLQHGAQHGAQYSKRKARAFVQKEVEEWRSGGEVHLPFALVGILCTYYSYIYISL